MCEGMKGKFLELVKKSRKLRTGVAVAALAVVIGSVGVYEFAQVPELPVYTADPVIEVTIEEDEVPLAAKSTTTTKTSKSTSTKTTKLSKKSKKTYSKSLGTTTKTSTKTTKSTTKTVKKQTTVKTSKKENYYKNKNYKKVTTTKVTTVKTTTTTTTKAKYEVSVDKLAPKMDETIRKAFTTLGFKVYIDNSVNYSGYFDAKNRTITLKAEDDTIYHELGHFLAFISGNTDTTASFKSIYSAEKSKYTGTNKSYVIQNSSEYFAESVKDYILSEASLKSSRPQTYAAITTAMSKVTTAQVNKLKVVYAAYWK